jgi:hypothetical protein
MDAQRRTFAFKSSLSISKINKLKNKKEMASRNTKSWI